MPTEESFALLLSWTCYGNWLPGDKRGYVSNTKLAGKGWLEKQNIPGTDYARDDPFTRHQARTQMKQPPARLSAEHAREVAESLIECAGKRSWRILRAAVMANHVHVVICECPDDGPAVRRILKGNTQAALCKKSAVNRTRWTRGGSDRYLHGDDAIVGAIAYVANQEFKLAEIVDMKIVIPE